MSLTDGEGPVMVSSALVPTRSFQSMRDGLVRQFGAALGAAGFSVDRYEWRFVPEGSVLVEYDDTLPLLADEDCIEIHAFGGSA